MRSFNSVHVVSFILFLLNIHQATAVTVSTRWEVGQIIDMGDYLVSNKSFVILQADANVCMYYGSGPSHNLGYRWCVVNKSYPGRLYYARLENDGLFCVYHSYEEPWLCLTAAQQFYPVPNLRISIDDSVDKWGPTDGEYWVYFNDYT